MRRFVQRSLFPATFLVVVVGAQRMVAYGISPALIPLVATTFSLGWAVLVERLLPRVARPPQPNETRTDLGFVAVTATISDPFAQALTASAAALAADALGSPLAGLHGLPLLAGACLALLVHGLGDYWAHRFGHEWSWWWKLHSVHHAPHRMVALNNLRLHPVDVLLKVLLGMGPVLVLGFTPEMIAMAGAIKGVCIAFQHANADLRHGLLNRVFATNSVHRWHHSANPREANGNYGAVLSVFDQLFRTYRVPPEDRDPERMGLFDEARYPIHTVVRASVAPLCWRACVGPRSAP